ncbi:polysaccharide deacetylase family protein [Lacrimispora sp. 210928-DFI.3.58]|uniref:polysaccharide deacetylase family protein n=1 Tax=Lacrimispora sp. 210928-DFI.3.58 TaxID=2883214 RepID=UPI0015B4D054|nr:polysaccharide deacetylase family protein [Lacrimispora sp. 210928-DFI.3.58]MCB7320231.1 polysaccharide deacetylase family protein [Lacrimispora sp. 210928-DFI.3.58]
MKLKYKIWLFALLCAADVFLLTAMVRTAALSSGHVHVSAEEGEWRLENTGNQTIQPEPDRKVDRCIALTFDDGPHPVCTPKLLDGLKERGVHATFFLMGQNIEGNEAIIKRMQEEGHLIGNHSYSHVQLSKAGTGAVCRAVDDTSRLIEEITGERPRYLRPPYGDWREELECQVDLTTVLWSVDSLDWKLRNSDRIVKRVLKDAEEGDIILMHDIFPTSVSAALRIVDELKDRGYTFVTVDELLID